MKQAWATVILTIAILPFAMSFGGYQVLAQTCPSPTPSCSGAGLFAGGNFGCTGVRTDSDGIVRAEVFSFSISPAVGGAGTASTDLTSNDNSSSGTTFKDFSPQSGITYCVNSDDTTGYFFYPTESECPHAFVIDEGGNELRLLNSEENAAHVITCRKH
jgi:hypothetical protein